jgi:two-component system sensor histidine kinase DesK
MRKLHLQEQAAVDGEGPVEAQDVASLSRISPHLWRLYGLFWLICLVFPILSLTQMRLEPGGQLAAAAGLAMFAITYLGFMLPYPARPDARLRSGSRMPPWILGGLTLLILSLSAAYGSTFLWLLVGLSAMVGVAIQARAAFAAVMALTLLTLGAGVWLEGGIGRTDWFQLLPLVLLVRGLGLDMVGLVRLSDALRELHAARGELARRAVSEERLRLARDLHDLLGQTLALITLKSELAGRLLEKEPASAAQEIRQVERAARQALREVREAVAGYRQPALRSELDGARQLLEAAGIACTVETTGGRIPPAVDALLAWAVREGVTNVIRHSRAKRCTIRVSCEKGTARVEVANDGGREPEGSRRGITSGSGLSGLTERLTAGGGRLEAGPTLAEGSPGFRLRVELPLGDGQAGEGQRAS